MNFNMFSSISYWNSLGPKEQSPGKEWLYLGLLQQNRYTFWKKESHVDKINHRSLLQNCLTSLLLLKSLPCLHPDQDYVLLPSFLAFVDLTLTIQGWFPWGQLTFKDIESGVKHLLQGRFPIPGIPTPAFSTCSACTPGNSYLLLSEIRYTWSIIGHIPRVLSDFALFLGSQPVMSARNWAEATHTSQEVALRTQSWAGLWGDKSQHWQGAEDNRTSELQQHNIHYSY